MSKEQQEDMYWFEFRLFQPFQKRLRHACFTRLGGVSKESFDSLNVSYTVGDVESAVQENRARVARHFQVESNCLFDVEQVHTTVSVVAETTPTSVQKADILLTRKPGNILMIKHADCQAGLLYDPVHHVVAAVHAGWKGLIQKAYTKALVEMKNLWQTEARDVCVGIGPSLGLCHSEFMSYKQEFPQELWQFASQDAMMDLHAIAKSELVQAGVLPEHIEIMPLCTFKEKDLFFSYRRNHVTGRCATCIQLL